MSISRLRVRPGDWVLFFTLLGFGLRLQRLSFQPLWGDEGWSFYFATQSLPQLIALTAIDIHPPLYYVLLKIWLFIAGTGAEEARFLSVIYGTLLIPVVYLLGARLFRARVGLAAAGVTSLMPLAVYYSQEVRMYGLVTLLGAASTYFFIGMQDRRRVDPHRSVERSNRFSPKGCHLGYVITTTAALYTMYYATFVILFQLLHTLITSLRQKRRSLVTAFQSFLFIGLLYLPWLIYATPRLVSYVDNKRNVEGYTPLGVGRYFGDHFVTFSLGHLSESLQVYGWTALVVGVVAVIGLILAPDKGNRYLLLLLYLIVPLSAGYLINQLYPFTPRFYERTLLLAAPAYWLFVALGLQWLWDRHFLLGGAAASLILLMSTASLVHFYGWLRYPEEDYRPLLADVAARATAEDTLLASYQWQLGLYRAYLPSRKTELFAVPGWGRAWSSQATDDSRLVADLTALFERSSRLWFPAYQASGHIWEDEAEEVIARLGYPALLKWYSPQTKVTLAGAGSTLSQRAADVNFGDQLILLEAFVGNDPYEAGRDIVPVKLVWQKKQSLDDKHRVSLRLVDEAGRTWTTRDSYPQAGQTFFADLAVGDRLSDHHGLLTPAGAPPGQYKLLLSVRCVSDGHPLDLLDEAGQPVGAELLLGTVELAAPDPPVGAAALPVQTAVEANFGGKARLVGYSLGKPPFKIGEMLPLTLFWQSLEDGLDPLTVLVELQDAAGQVVVSSEQEPLWPTTEWERGTVLRDPKELLLPPTLPPGEYELLVSLLTSEKIRLAVADSDRLRLRTISVVDRPRNFEAPEPDAQLAVNFGNQAQLAGVDLPDSRVEAGGVLPLTLHWQALATPEESWKVFVHLIDQEGRIVSQQDQIPGAGQFPTTGWVPQEYVVDPYQIPIPADALAGEEAYRLRIGLYNANTFERLPVIEDGKIISDHVVLESWPISVE